MCGKVDHVTHIPRTLGTCIFMSRRINIQPIHISFSPKYALELYKQTDRLRIEPKQKEFYFVYMEKSLANHWLKQKRNSRENTLTLCWQIVQRRRRRRTKRSRLRFECVCLGYAILAFWSRLTHTLALSLSLSSFSLDYCFYFLVHLILMYTFFEWISSTQMDSIFISASSSLVLSSLIHSLSVRFNWRR